MPREASKCREWEKERRDRLSNSFSNLGKKLPCYQPSVNLSKIEILHKAANYIEELEVQIKEFVDKNATKISCDKIKKLRDQIKKLLIRNEQLCNLLKDAGIRFPSECGSIKFKSPKKWANKISPEQAKILADKEAQKENQSKPQKKIEKPKKLKSLTPKQKASVKRKERKKIIQSAFRLNIAQTNLLGITNSQSCFIITNTTCAQSNISKATTVLTNSRVFSTPLVASSIKQSGTLFMANTNILPVIHQPIVPTATLLTNSNPVLVNSGLANSNLPTMLTNTPIIVKNSSNVIQHIQSSAKATSSSPSAITTTSKTTTVIVTPTTQLSSTSKPPTKILPLLRPKAYTCTTQINKVPIPALSSEYNKTLLYAANLNKSTKVCVSKKKDKLGSGKKDKKGIVITQNIVLSKAKVDKNEELAKSDEENVNQNEEKNNLEVLEPAEKKLKLDENVDTSKKGNNTLTYSIDALCNEPSETNNISTEEVNNKEIKETVIEQNKEIFLEIAPENKDDKEENCDSAKIDNSSPIAKEIESDRELPTESIEAKPQKESTTDNSTQKQDTKPMDIPEPLHSELSNDIFASLSHVAAGGQNPESTSPTAAFLLAFPLVSSLNSLKVTEVIEDEATESQHGTPTLLQIGTMDTTKTTQSLTDNLTPNLLNLDNFSFFSKEFYPSFDSIITTVENTSFVCHTVTSTLSSLPTAVAVASNTSDNNVSSLINGTSTTEATKSNNDNKYEFLPKLQKTATTTSQVYSVAKSETITYTTSAINKDTPKPVNKEKNYDLQQTNYVASSYNLPYSQPFFAKTDTISTTTIANTAEKLGEKPKDKKPCYYAYSVPTTSTVTQYNTFNPFTDIPIKPTTTSYITPKPINDMLYTNNTNYSYSYSDNFNTNYSKPSAKNDKIYYGLNYENYDYKNYDNRNQQYCYNANQNQKNASETAKNNTNANVRPPVNWMTTPDIRQQDFAVPPIPKDMDFPYSSNSFAATSQATYFNTNASLYSSTDFHNTPFPTVPPNTFQRNDVEENQFSWSPSKLPQLLDQQHSLVATTLPTLVGDLALGTNQSIFNDQKPEKRPKDAPRRNKVQNFDAHNSFLSVSQLVDHNKTDGVPSRVSNRRSSGNRSSKQTTSTKPTKKVGKSELPKEIPNYPKDVWNEKNLKYDYQHNNWNNKNRSMKNPSSNYSAEALIGHQNQKNQSYTPVVNKSLPVPFLTENLLPYFPVDIPQDNLIQQNQNYHNFPSSIQNSVYSSNSFVPNPITTSYLPSANFISDIGSTDYNSDNFGHGLPKFSKPKSADRDDKRHATPSNSCSLNTPKKSKKKQSEALPGLVDFSFLPMPGAINSPILPDDFHSHANFLPPPTPTQLYPCKNPLYPKQGAELGHNLLPVPSVTRSGVPHPEISPSLNSMSSSVSNFNLSTIFPEINKGSGAIMDMYAEINKP